MAQALDEQETNFTVEATNRNVVSVFSNDIVWQNRIEKLGIVAYRSDVYGRFYKIDLTQYNFGIHRKRQMSDEQRAAAAERLAALRNDAGSDDEEYEMEGE